MGRKRQKDHHLPPRFHIKGKACYHVGKPAVDPRTGKERRPWAPIGSTDDLPAAIEKWGRVEASSRAIQGNSVAALFVKYTALLEDPNNPLGLSPRTIREYVRMLRAEPPSTMQKVFGDMNWNDLAPPHIGEYLDTHPKPVAANREIALLSRIYRWAIRRGHATTNPCDGVERNKETGSDRYVEDWEYVAVRKFCREYTNGNGVAPWVPLAFAMDISYLTSFRLGDVIRLQVADYDDQYLGAREHGIQEGKTGFRARAEMTPDLKHVIEQTHHTLRRRMTTFTLLTSRDGKGYTEGGFKSAWQRMIKTAVAQGVIHERFTFHAIRAKHATDKDEQGLNAQLALGHTDPKMTAKYIRHRKGRRIDTLKTEIVEAPADFVEEDKSGG